ncbi:1-acyl-sn-glycerol-3-phosphate acyltransferase BAT2, chloroplastic-like [Pistacia vera]|uniref:1-acyl-sn-glycerol-3-phosphate acyltransferase BAT2, chloroplastic-like n=1 Tax=Pistacia vera TaxID=55513 RepID=UPI00126342DA|nr:1-acyl-sn-glycerol-3-phosphate acyltransferase BAT2, chloroplastic-like [Pistacia vera]XP_031274405.1 1-acyl-sn-glycerol-3-phosphate acyltransferase BAT2, chloroplastic-like [Pistacia vera]XP_031274406.1 1-acyl-sn-glycerol-3-phosphate acyltransferase BAT2, chloroplastic-like [Pistacia vera]XP_031274407.1 1-acyl-sn-glycerol-3-phosphate acyltransferase BAT2, chloroplastic-like [Pistacia vera]
MEVTAAAYPSLTTPFHLRNLSTSSSHLCAYKGQSLVSSSYKHAVLRSSYSSAQNGFLCMPRKKLGVLWAYSDLKRGNLNRPYYDFKLHNYKKLSRSVLVRSELAGNGAPNSAYALSEVKLGSKVRGISFYAVTAVAAILLIGPMLVAHPLVLLLDRYQRKFQHFIAKVWATLTVSLFFRIKFEGLENLPPPGAPAVYVSNHQSFLDIYTLLTLGRSFKFISKTAIFLFPIIGWAMSMMGVIPLKRMDSKSQLECLKRCMDLIKKGASVFFFPEGTRSKDGKLGAFKKGAFSVAAKTGVPVVPMTLMGTGKIMPSGMEGILNSGSVKVVIHKPLQGRNPDVMCSEARKTIADTLSLQG